MNDTCGCGPNCNCGPDCACGPAGRCNPACRCGEGGAGRRSGWLGWFARILPARCCAAARPA